MRDLIRGRRVVPRPITRRIVGLLVPLLLVVLWPGGGSADPHPTTPSTRTDEARSTLDALRATAHEQRTELDRLLRFELERIEAGISHLRSQSQQASESARRELQQTIRELEDKQARMAVRLKEVPRATAAAWEELTAAIADAVRDLHDALGRAAARPRE